MSEPIASGWRKSSRSGDNGCVEVAADLVGVVAVRDSKETAGPVLLFPPAAWRSFLAGLPNSS